MLQLCHSALNIVVKARSMIQVVQVLLIQRYRHAPSPTLISLSTSKYIYHKCLFQLSTSEYLNDLLNNCCQNQMAPIEVLVHKVAPNALVGNLHATISECERNKEKGTNFISIQKKSRVWFPPGELPYGGSFALLPLPPVLLQEFLQRNSKYFTAVAFP